MVRKNSAEITQPSGQRAQKSEGVGEATNKDRGDACKELEEGRDLAH